MIINDNKVFVSIHHTDSSADMCRLDDVYRTIKAVNELLGTKLRVHLEYTDGIKEVPPGWAKYAEALIVNDQTA